MKVDLKSLNDLKGHSIDPYFKYRASCPTHNGTLSTYIRATIWKILLLFYLEKVSQLH